MFLEMGALGEGVQLWTINILHLFLHQCVFGTLEQAQTQSIGGSMFI
jgi:hypothetical protein